MLEIPHKEPAVIPQVKCEAPGCVSHNLTQIYTVEQTRPLFTREWVFCSLACLRKVLGK